MNDHVWRKSTRCEATNCVEVTFTRSSRCAYADCVEVAHLDQVVLVRDSKNPDLHLTFTHDEWDAFVVGAKLGEFDL